MTDTLQDKLGGQSSPIMTDRQYAACASVLFLSPIVQYMMKHGDIQMYGDDFCFVHGYVLRGHSIIIATLTGACIRGGGEIFDRHVFVTIGNILLGCAIIIVLASLVTIYKNISIVDYKAGEKSSWHPSRLLSYLFHR